MFWLTLMASVALGALFAWLLTAVRVAPGLACIVSPVLAVAALFLGLDVQPWMYVGPLAIVPLFIGFWLAMAAAALTCRLMFRRATA